MQYSLQKGHEIHMPDGFAPKIIDKLPDDIPQLDKGDWKYSELLKGWVGYILTQEQVERLYEERILKA